VKITIYSNVTNFGFMPSVTWPNRKTGLILSACQRRKC